MRLPCSGPGADEASFALGIPAAAVPTHDDVVNHANALFIGTRIAELSCFKSRDHVSIGSESRHGLPHLCPEFAFSGKCANASQSSSIQKSGRVCTQLLTSDRHAHPERNRGAPSQLPFHLTVKSPSRSCPQCCRNRPTVRPAKPRWLSKSQSDRRSGFDWRRQSKPNVDLNCEDEKVLGFQWRSCDGSGRSPILALQTFSSETFGHKPCHPICSDLSQTLRSDRGDLCC